MVEIGNLKEKIKISVVDASIPLLLGLDYQKKWRMVIYLGQQEILIRKSREKFKEKEVNHRTLPIQKKKLHEDWENLVFTVNLKKMEDKELRKHMTKIHKNICHKSEEQLTKLFQMAKKDS